MADLMKNRGERKMAKRLVALMTIAIISISTLSTFQFAKANATLTLSDEELSTQFAKGWGPATATITDIPGSGVKFDFTGLTESGTAMRDDYPVSQLAGGALDGIGGYGDFRRYTQYRLVFTNTGPSWISVNLFMNTGWTNTDWTRDTYWENGWIYIEPMKSAVVTLDFSSATCYNAQDDPVPEWRYLGGTSGVIIRRLNEVSNLGFQVCGNGTSAVIVSAATPTLTATLSDAEMGGQFAYEYGPGTVTAITDIAGPGVRFDFTGLSTSSGTTVGDDYPVSQLAGGALDGIGGYGDFSIYSRYSMIFTNIGPASIMACLKMNTGWTYDPTRDTYWQSPWTQVDVGETETLTLEFTGAIVYNAMDDPDPSWQYADGTVHPVHRLDEVSDIGFQVLGDDVGSIVVTRVVDVPLTLSDAELSTQFVKETGPGTVTAISDIPDAGVLFEFAGLSLASGTVVGDNFAVSSLAGGAWKDYGNGFAGPYDFSAYTCYNLAFTNVGQKPVTINLKMNTGWIDAPWGTLQRDTFWQGKWTYLAPYETRIVTLDFWSAETWNAADDPISEWQYSDGTAGVIVRRLDEVSDIGFQILGDGEATIKVTSFFDVFLSLSDAEMGGQFAYEYGPGTVTAITDIAGPGVRFDFTGLSTSSGTTVGDDFAVSDLAGGAYKTYGVTTPFSTRGDFSAYTKYRMIFTNVGTKPVTVNLKLNTGWTAPPPEYAAAWRDTFWQNTWTYIAPGESKTIILDFFAAEVWNAVDEKEYIAYPDGTTGIVVWRLDEVSDIGFQILGDGEGSVIVSGRPSPSEVYVDDDYTSATPDWGYDHFAKIQDGIDAVTPSGLVHIYDGTYLEALYIGKTLTLKAESTPIIRGSQLFAMDLGNREAVIFVENAVDVVLEGLDVEGEGLGPVKNYAIVYENSTGIVRNCVASPNTIGDMYSTGIAGWSRSDLLIENCTVHNFGRVGIYATNVENIDIINNEIIGQIYDLDNLVSYGIEIEDYGGPSDAAITENDIYNSDNTHPSPLWSSAAIIVDIWRAYYDLTPSTVAIEHNDIHDNYEAIEVVANPLLHAHYNNIYDNRYGVWVDADLYSNYDVFDARYNWWGDASGPLHETSWLYLGEPYGPHFGAGNDVGDYVLYYPWLGEPSGEPVEPPTASFTYTPPGPKAGELATLDASSSTANGGTITEYEWNFGDGNTTTTSDPVIKHAFGSAATYNVTLTITDSEGLTDSTWQSVTVVPATVPVYAYMKVEPPLYYTKKRGTIFTINVTLYNITESMQLVAVEFKLRYNTTLLRAINATEGPFLSSYGGSPHQGTYFNLMIHSDYVLIGIAILPDVHGIYHYFPSGNGTLATITFEAIYQPMGLEKPNSTCNLQLFDTKLADSLGIPPGMPHNVQNGGYSIGPTPWGDVNYDGIVDIFDITAVAIIFGSEPDNPNWNADADLNGDKIIDIFDIVTVALHFGEEDP
jgi:hypothetical protein